LLEFDTKYQLRS